MCQLRGLVGGGALSEESITLTSLSHGVPKINFRFGMDPRVDVPVWPGGGSPSSFSSSVHLLPFLLFLLLVPRVPLFPSPIVLHSLPEVPRGIGLSCQHGNLLRNTSFVSFPNSLKGLPGISFQMNFLLPDPRHRVCFWGNLS